LEETSCCAGDTTPIMAVTTQLLLALLVCATTLLHAGAGQTREDVIKKAVEKMEDDYLKPVLEMKTAMKKREGRFTPKAYRRWWPDRQQCRYQDNTFCRAFSSDDAACNLAPQLCPCGMTGRVDCTSTWRVCREAQPHCTSTKKLGMEFKDVCENYKDECPCGNTKSVVCKHLRFQRKNKPKNKNRKPTLQRERRLPNPMEKPKLEQEPLPEFHLDSLQLQKPLASSSTEQRDDSAEREKEYLGQSSEEDSTSSEEDHASSEEDHASSEEDQASSEEDLTVRARDLTTMIKRGGLDRSRVGRPAGHHNKQKPARTQMLLEVKPLHVETDMARVEELVRAVQRDGLEWGKSKLVEIGYGIKKLQISCAVELDKVSIDWLLEQIKGLKDFVQSVDVADVRQNGVASSRLLHGGWWWMIG